MTDIQAIRQHLRKLVDGIDATELDALLAVLGKAQNAPPEGEADGTVSAQDWRAASEVARSLAAARRMSRGVLES